MIIIFADMRAKTITGCPQGLKKLEKQKKGLILENGLEKLEKHILFIVLKPKKLEKAYFGHKACVKKISVPIFPDL